MIKNKNFFQSIKSEIFDTIKLGIFIMKMSGDFYINIPLILLILGYLYGSIYFITLIDCKSFIDIENGLFPVSVSIVWTGRESDWDVTMREVDLKPSDISVHVIVSVDFNIELIGEF